MIIPSLRRQLVTFGSRFSPRRLVSNTIRPVLSFDPANTEADFTAYKVLPFIQHRLNERYLASIGRGAPNHNLRPTEDQRKLLSILQSNHSAILNGGVGTGKSLAAAIYALNLSLSRVPKYGVIRKRASIDSVILVPTDDMVERYKEYFTMLTKDIPPLCCPDELKSQKGGSTYELTRRSLVIEYLYSHDSAEFYSSDQQPAVPQIIVSTLSGLERVMNNDENQLTKRNHLLDLQLFAVDDFSFFLKSSHIGYDCMIEKSGSKSKYSNKIEKLIKEIQSTHMKSFSDGLNKRLDNIRAKDRMDHPAKSFSSADLEKRVIKQKRKFLYKPIQFCFMSKCEEPFKYLLQVKSSADQMKSFNNVIQAQYHSQPKGSESNKLHDLYSKYLIEKGNQMIHRDEDLLKKMVEKIIRFNDSQRLLKERERKLIFASSNISLQHETSNLTSENQASSRDLKHCETNQNINAYFSIGLPDAKSNLSLYTLDVSTKYPSDSSIVDHMDGHIKLARSNIKNLEKSYLKYKIRADKDMTNSANIRKYLPSLLSEFKIKNPDNNSKFLIIVPDYVNIRKIIKKLESTCKTEKFVSKSLKVEQPFSIESTSHIILTASQCIGFDFTEYPNLIVFGIDSLIPQFAFASKASIPKSEELISGVVDPYDDLSVYYMAKLNTSASKDRNVIFVFDAYTKAQTNNERLKFEQSLKRFSQIVMYNNFMKTVNCKKLFNEERTLPYGIDETYVKVIQQNAKMK